MNKNIGVKRIPVGRPSVIYQPRVEGIVPIMKITAKNRVKPQCTYHLPRHCFGDLVLSIRAETSLQNFCEVLLVFPSSVKA